MQAKPLALTVIVVGVLAFMADVLLIGSGPETRFEQSQVAPMPSRHLLKPDTTVVAPPIVLLDSLETSLTVVPATQRPHSESACSEKVVSNPDPGNPELRSHGDGWSRIFLPVWCPRFWSNSGRVRIAQSIKGVQSVTSELKLAAGRTSISVAGSE